MVNDHRVEIPIGVSIYPGRRIGHHALYVMVEDFYKTLERNEEYLRKRREHFNQFYYNKPISWEDHIGRWDRNYQERFPSTQ